jgi:hypothetical protein
MAISAADSDCRHSGHVGRNRVEVGCDSLYLFVHSDRHRLWKTWPHSESFTTTTMSFVLDDVDSRQMQHSVSVSVSVSVLSSSSYGSV